MEFTTTEKNFIIGLIKNDFDFRKDQIKILGNDDKDAFVRICKDYKQRDLGVLKKFCRENDFVCEICGTILDKNYEGADPNTCSECNPIKENDNDAD